MKEVNKLYLIDDDEIFQFITKKVIEHTNLVQKIEVFNNGQETIDYIKSYQQNPEKLPDVILLDLTMPILDGWGFLEEYHKLNIQTNKQIHIYIVTSSIDPADYEKANSVSEVTDFVIKPVTKDKFQELIENL